MLCIYAGSNALKAIQSEHHYATQESVDNLKEQMNVRFEQVDKKLDRLQWFIVAACLVVVFKDNILSFPHR